MLLPDRSSRSARRMSNASWGRIGSSADCLASSGSTSGLRRTFATAHLANSSLDVEGADRARSGVGEVISSAYRPGRLSPKLNRATVHTVRTQVFTRSHARSECGHRIPDKGGGCSRPCSLHGLERARRLQGSEELYGARGGGCTSRWQRTSMGRQRFVVLRFRYRRPQRVRIKLNLGHGPLAGRQVQLADLLPVFDEHGAIVGAFGNPDRKVILHER